MLISRGDSGRTAIYRCSGLRARETILGSQVRSCMLHRGRLLRHAASPNHTIGCWLSEALDSSIPMRSGLTLSISAPKVLQRNKLASCSASVQVHPRHRATLSSSIDCDRRGGRRIRPGAQRFVQGPSVLLEVLWVCTPCADSCAQRQIDLYAVRPWWIGCWSSAAMPTAWTPPAARSGEGSVGGRSSTRPHLSRSATPESRLPAP